MLLAAATVGLGLYNGLLASRALAACPRWSFIHHRGTKLHFLEAGHGQSLLVLHGNGASAEDFTTSGIFDKAAATYHVLAFDRPGFGLSPRPAGRPWTAGAQADLIQTAAETLGIERYIVVGHSRGPPWRSRWRFGIPDPSPTLWWSPAIITRHQGWPMPSPRCRRFR